MFSQNTLIPYSQNAEKISGAEFVVNNVGGKLSITILKINSHLLYLNSGQSKISFYFRCLQIVKENNYKLY